jgi:hypothetical protein
VFAWHVLEPFEEGSEVVLLLFEGLRENEDVVWVCKAEVESLQNVVHEALNRLGCIAQAEGHERELEEAKRSGDGNCFLLFEIKTRNRFAKQQ